MPRLVRRYTLTNPLGLHARAASVFVRAASAFEADVTVSYRGAAVNGKSILGLMFFLAPCGSELEVVADGVDAEALLERLAGVIGEEFHAADINTARDLEAAKGAEKR